eukprot:1160218-Pelagomonas_calceolata.AAC.25
MASVDLSFYQAQPPSCYGALVMREEGDSKEEIPGSNPWDRILVARVEIKMPSVGGSHWEALSLMHAAEWQAGPQITLLPSDHPKNTHRSTRVAWTIIDFQNSVSVIFIYHANILHNKKGKEVKDWPLWHPFKACIVTDHNLRLKVNGGKSGSDQVLDSKSVKTTHVDAVGVLEWRLSGQKVGFTSQLIRHSRKWQFSRPSAINGYSLGNRANKGTVQRDFSLKAAHYREHMQGACKETGNSRPQSIPRAKALCVSCYGALVRREEGNSKEEVPGSSPCGRGGDKDALYRWESMGDSFLNTRGRTTSVDLSFFLCVSFSYQQEKKEKNRQAQAQRHKHSSADTSSYYYKSWHSVVASEVLINETHGLRLGADRRKLVRVLRLVSYAPAGLVSSFPALHCLTHSYYPAKRTLQV